MIPPRAAAATVPGCSQTSYKNTAPPPPPPAASAGASSNIWLQSPEHFSSAATTEVCWHISCRLIILKHHTPTRRQLLPPRNAATSHPALLLARRGGWGGGGGGGGGDASPALFALAGVGKLEGPKRRHGGEFNHLVDLLLWSGNIPLISLTAGCPLVARWESTIWHFIMLPRPVSTSPGRRGHSSASSLKIWTLNLTQQRVCGRTCVTVERRVLELGQIEAQKSPAAWEEQPGPSEEAGVCFPCEFEGDKHLRGYVETYKV